MDLGKFKFNIRAGWAIFPALDSTESAEHPILTGRNLRVAATSLKSDGVLRRHLHITHKGNHRLDGREPFGCPFHCLDYSAVLELQT